MKVLVLGGGIAGVTAAYFIARDGHEVTLVEAQDALGLDATAANAGIIAPGHSAWASPRAPGLLWRSLLGQETAIRMRLARPAALRLGGFEFLRECTAERARRNTLIKLRLPVQPGGAERGRAQRGHRLRGRGPRRACLYRDPSELEAGVKKMALLAEQGQKQEVLDAAAVARLDPVFEPVQHKIAGAVRDLTDSSGDARIFTEALARVGREKLGLTIQLGTRVGELESAGDCVQAVFTTRGTLTADVYVLALGVAAPLVARTIGVGLQVYPAKGYSSTFPIKTGDRAPTIPGVDEAVAGGLVAAG